MIDLFPVDFRNIQKVKGPRLRILRKDEIEAVFDPSSMIENDWIDIGENTSALPWIQASSNFVKLIEEAVRNSKSF